MFERIDAEVAPMRERYEALVAHPDRIEAQLREGAQRLRERYATPRLKVLREAVGLRDLGQRVQARGAAKAATQATPASFKQYREADGKFYFKLVEGDRVLLQSAGFSSPRDAGLRIAALKGGAFAGADEEVALGAGIDAEAVQAALAAIAAAEAEKA